MSRYRRFGLVLVAAFLLGAGHVVSIGASDGGIDVYSGGIDMHSNQISNLADPSSAQDAATRSWVNNNDQNTNAGTECSGGSTYLAGNGSCMNDQYEADTNANTECVLSSSFLTGSGGCQDYRQFGEENKIEFGSASGSDSSLQEIDVSANSDPDMVLYSEATVRLQADQDQSDGGPHTCDLDLSGNWNCEGSKNWVHQLNDTHEVVYSSQESPEVRAVFEGQASVENGRVNVSLPAHFSGTVSDERPSLRVQVTPHELATVAVTERTDSWIMIKSSKDVAVDYRVTGIREGYEYKEVVRERK